LVDSIECVKVHGPTNPKYFKTLSLSSPKLIRVVPF